MTKEENHSISSREFGLGHQTNYVTLELNALTHTLYTKKSQKQREKNMAITSLRQLQQISSAKFVRLMSINSPFKSFVSCDRVDMMILCVLIVTRWKFWLVVKLRLILCSFLLCFFFAILLLFLFVCYFVMFFRTCSLFLHQSLVLSSNYFCLWLRFKFTHFHSLKTR